MSVGAVNKQTGDRIPTAGMPAIDNALDLTSVNPVQNAVITAALAGKTDTGIVADDFDSTASYVIGNYCIKDGKLYRFKANHSGAWAAADVDEIQITGELATLKSGLINLNGYIKTYNSANTNNKVLRITTQYGKQPVIIALVNNGVGGKTCFGMVTVFSGFVGVGEPTVTTDGTNLTIDFPIASYSGDVLMISSRDFTFAEIDPS